MVTRSISVSVIDRVTFIEMGLTSRDADSDGTPFLAALATGPAWPIWPATSAPSSWMVSTSFRSPGTAAGRSQMQPSSVRPSGATAR